MSIELDGIPLIRHIRDEETGATRVLKSVYNISVSEKRRIIEQRIPSMEGGFIQDLGREPVRISFEGIIYGGEAKEALGRIMSKFKAGKPIPFSSDVSGVAEVTDVLIEALQVDDMGGMPNNYKYRIVLREYTPPPQKDEPPTSQDEEAKEAVEQQTDEDLASENYIIGNVLDPSREPIIGAKVTITGEDREYQIETNEEGIYRLDKLKPGKYIVTIDAKGYGIKKEEKEIKN